MYMYLPTCLSQVSGSDTQLNLNDDILPQGHFRRGTVLEKLGQWEEALAAYFLCLHFNSRSSDITPIICQVCIIVITSIHHMLANLDWPNRRIHYLE